MKLWSKICFNYRLAWIRVFNLIDLVRNRLSKNDLKLIRKALKELFDIDEFSNQTTESEFTSPTAYTYLAEADIYIVTTNTEYTSYVSDKQFMDFSTISTEAKDGKIVSTVAVAYCYQDNDGTSCATDKEGTNVVAKNVDGFPKDHIDNFDKFEFTMKKSKDGKSFVFESVKKVK